MMSQSLFASGILGNLLQVTPVCSGQQPAVSIASCLELMGADFAVHVKGAVARVVVRIDVITDGHELELASTVHPVVFV